MYLLGSNVFELLKPIYLHNIRTGVFYTRISLELKVFTSGDSQICALAAVGA